MAVRGFSAGGRNVVHVHTDQHALPILQDHPGFLRHLPPGRFHDGTIPWLEVSARLEPPAEARVIYEQDGVAVVREHQPAGRDVAGHELGSDHGIGRSLDQGQDRVPAALGARVTSRIEGGNQTSNVVR